MWHRSEWDGGYRCLYLPIDVIGFDSNIIRSGVRYRKRTCGSHRTDLGYERLRWLVQGLASMRTIAYNVYGATGYPEPTHARDGAIADDLATELGAQDAEVLSFSEAPPLEVVESIGAELGMETAFFPSRGNWPGAVFSVYPISSAAPLHADLPDLDDELLTRHAGRAVLEAPFGELVVYSIHLYPKADAHDRRLREIGRIRDRIETDVASDRRVLLQGDLNHPPTATEYDEWRLLGLTDTYVAAGIGPSKTIKAFDPDRRIDYIWADGSLTEQLVEAQVIQKAPFGSGDPNNPLPDRFLSDHLPVSARFEL